MPHPTHDPSSSSDPPFGQPFVELPSVDSTNNYAMAKVHAGLATEGACFFAWEQTQGKGQRGKTWVSNKGQNLMLSLVLEPGWLPQTQAFALSQAVALACLDLIGERPGESWSIKWPNDLYYRDRKAGGILIESIWQGTRWQYAIAGIGINVNQVEFPPLATQAISLKNIRQQDFALRTMAQDLCRCIQVRYLQLRQEGPALLQGQYLERLYKKGEAVWLEHQGFRKKLWVRGVDARGFLEVSVTPQGPITFLESGSVSWLAEGS